jgi:putative aldouronate transport system permease protein
MKKKRTVGDWIFDTINYLLLLSLVVVTLFPLWHVLVTSFASPEAITKYGSTLIWPEGFNMKSYTYVFSNPMIGIGYQNTIILVIVGTTLSMLMTCFGAYTLSCKWLMGRKFLVLLVTIPMFFGGGLIPSYLLVRQLGLYNSFWAVRYRCLQAARRRPSRH